MTEISNNITGEETIPPLATNKNLNTLLLTINEIINGFSLLSNQTNNNLSFS